MVAISIYKGNLHRPPNTPRQWLMPTRKISQTDFKSLINRRSKALALLQSTSSNPNPISDPSAIEQQQQQPPQSNGSTEPIINGVGEFHVNGGNLVGDDDVDVLVAEVKAGLPESESNGDVDTSEEQVTPPTDDSLNDTEKRKKEVEEKLQVLNERKHKLVQVLKQLLNAEEELRRRSNVMGTMGRPCVSLQVDVTNDSGSMSRQITPRPGSEGADVGGGDADDMSNHNMHSRNMTRMSSMSPSSDSLPRRGPFSMIPNTTRGIIGSSPSRFAPTSNGHQQSATGTNYVASSPSPSPSPAGSGGTSVFRDAITSPWN